MMSDKSLDENLDALQWDSIRFHNLIEALKASPAALSRFWLLVPQDQVKKRTLLSLRESMAACLTFLPLTSGHYDA